MPGMICIMISPGSLSDFSSRVLPLVGSMNEPPGVLPVLKRYPNRKFSRGSISEDERGNSILLSTAKGMSGLAPFEVPTHTPVEPPR